MSRRITREKALQALFQMDVADADQVEAMGFVLEHEGNAVDPSYFKRLVEGTILHKDHIDQVIKRYSIGWELGRMPAVDRNVLRMATYELLFVTDVPENVVLNEAIEIVKAFSTLESGKFINGVLGKMMKDLPQLRTEVTDVQQPETERPEVE